MLINPVAGLGEGSEGWSLPIPVAATFALLVLGCAAQTASLILSRSRPALAALLALAVYVGLLFVLGAPQWLTSMQLVISLSLFLLGARLPPLEVVSWTIVVVTGGVGALTAWSFTTGADVGTLVGFLLASGLGFVAPATGGAALGAWWAGQVRRVDHAREEAEAARRDHNERVASARVMERSRIAQELHDVAGQHLAGLMTLADAAASLAADRPADALALLDEVRSEGRFAAASLAGALAELRASETAPMEATRDLRQSPELAAFWRRRGMDVTLMSLSDLDDLPAVVSTTAYRVLQEALTNAAKHAPGAEVTVRLAREKEMLEVAVENGPRRAGAPNIPGIGLGWGLSGLRERVQLLRGSFRAGETAEGGWLVRIRMPIAPIDSEER
jgi:signal transduction histidine kinase